MLKKEKKELLTKMKLIRNVEESIAEKYSENKIICVLKVTQHSKQFIFLTSIRNVIRFLLANLFKKT